MRTVLVTGSSRGIGRAIALRLACDGFEVVVHCRTNQEKARHVLAQIEAAGGKGRILKFDVADRNNAARVLIQDIELHGAYYGVVCNAGIARDNAFPAIDGCDWDAVIHTNLDGFYNVLHPVIMPMIRRKDSGRIVTLSSVSGVMGNRGQVNYSAAKAGIIGATKSLAIELGKRKITVNCIAPGLVETDMLKGAELGEALKMVPMCRVGKPEEIAALASFLFSDEAGYISRQVISINGGMY